MSFLNVSSSLNPRSHVESIDSSLTRLFVSEVTTELYFSVALATVLVYHSIITLDKEIKFFWPHPCNSVSMIYFANRYVGLFSAVCALALNLMEESYASCVFLIWTKAVTNIATFVMVDYILLIRVLALYHQHRALSAILKILLGLEIGTVLGLLIHSTLFEGIALGVFQQGIFVCVGLRIPPLTLATVSWVIPLAYGLILLCLALFRAAEYWKLSSGLKGFDLVRVLIRDQVLYFGFVIFCCVSHIVSISVSFTNPFAENALNAAGSPTLLCILGGQLLINLKEAGERGVNGGTNYTPRSVSDIEFGGNVADDEQNSNHESSV